MEKILAKTGLHDESFGHNSRKVFRRVPELLDVPYLLDVQMQSFKRFITQGIADILDEFNPITDYSNKVEMYFSDHYVANESKYDETECLRRGQMFVKPLKVRVRVVFKETGEVVEQEVFLGDIPMMTESGYFIVNGVARVIVNQIIKSPNVYFTTTPDKKTGRKIIENVITPTHGAYIEMVKGADDIINVYPNRSNRILLGVFLKALGLGTDLEIMRLFDHHPIIKATLDKDTLKTKSECLLEISRKMRPSELPDAAAMERNLDTMFFTFPNYDLAKVGRYKFNKKLCLASRIVKQIAAENIKIGDNIVVKKGDEISLDMAHEIMNSGINQVRVIATDENESKEILVIGNNRVDVNKYLGFKPEETGITELVHVPTMNTMFELAQAKTKAQKIEVLKDNAKKVVGRNLFVDDIIATVSYLLNLNDGIGANDNVDHLGNRRLNTAGDLMSRHFKEGMLKLRNSMRETMQTMEITSKVINPINIINAKAITRALKDFCSISQLSHVMDTNNPLTEITQKRKITSVGPGGITKERATAEVRDLHYTHNGRLCAVETPEGQSIGLVNSLAMFARVNEYGFITAPLRRVEKDTSKVTNIVDYLTADEEDSFFIAQATEPLDANGCLANEYILCRHKDIILEVTRDRVDYVDASPRQFVSLATALIPFVKTTTRVEPFLVQTCNVKQFLLSKQKLQS